MPFLYPICIITPFKQAFPFRGVLTPFRKALQRLLIYYTNRLSYLTSCQQSFVRGITDIRQADIFIVPQLRIYQPSVFGILVRSRLIRQTKSHSDSFTCQSVLLVCGDRMFQTRSGHVLKTFSDSNIIKPSGLQFLNVIGLTDDL